MIEFVYGFLVGGAVVVVIAGGIAANTRIKSSRAKLPPAINEFPGGLILPDPTDPRWADVGGSFRLGNVGVSSNMIRVKDLDIDPKSESKDQVYTYYSAIRLSYQSRFALEGIQD